MKYALQNGWRHIDTATIYRNEAEVGRGIRESGIPREQIFLTSKLQGADRNGGYDAAVQAFELSLEKIGTEYLDLYLIHWPASPFFHDDWKSLNAESWRALEDLYLAGRIRAIGVSNFMPRHLEELSKTQRIAPMVDQIEFHPGWMQKDCLEYCRVHDILVEAWAPLIKGEALTNPVIAGIAAAHGCSPAQVILSWVISNGVLPLCKSETPSRIEENLRSPEIKLSADEIDSISSLCNIGGRCYNPDCCDF